MDDTLLKADSVTIVVKAEKSGHLRVTCAAWDDFRAVLTGQVLELRFADGQVAVTRRTNAPARAGLALVKVPPA